jgi:ribosome biogenesis GTPase
MEPGGLACARQTLRSQTLNLSQIGWNNRFEALFEPFRGSGIEPGRLLRAERSLVTATTEHGVRLANLAGRLDNNGEQGPPAVGDWVALDLSSERGLVRAILPRASALTRRRPGAADNAQVVAANIDTVLVVESLDRGPSPRRIERGLALAWDGGANPIVVLTKADLCPDLGAAVDVARAGAPVTDIVAVSSTSGDGLDQLASHLDTGTTAVLLGPSGAGKSTLVNRLLGEAHLATGAVRSGDRKGRHTTSHRELVALPAGACLIDTPGIRELGLWLNTDAVNSAFAEIEALSGSCRFRDCSHQNEPGCAVQSAAAVGELDPARLASYLKLRREAEVLEERRDAARRHQVRARDRRFAKLCRAVQRRKSSERS